MAASDSSQMRRLLAAYPTLTDFGFGIYRPTGWRPSPAEVVQRFAEQRAILLTATSLAAFAAARGWFAKAERTKRPNRAAGSSYGLKHRFEHAPGGSYITNGNFIAAAIAAGLAIEQIGNGPNALLSLSRRWLRMVRAGLAPVCSVTP